jgi:hypothetical protein
MERIPQYDKKSIYLLIKNQQINKIDLKLILQLNEGMEISSDLIKIKRLIDELHIKIINSNEDISKLFIELEFYLPHGNNNKKLSQIFYNSKIFLNIIECLNYSKPKFITQLLNFIEKMLKGNKNISNYLSNNKEFIKKIFSLMILEEFYENCLKICEEIFMYSSKIIPILPFYKQIEENYLRICKGNLHTFCRILAIMIFDHKKMEFKQIFKYKENLKIRPSPKVTTENQSMCYNMNRFIHNIITVLK